MAITRDTKTLRLTAILTPKQRSAKDLRDQMDRRDRSEEIQAIKNSRAYTERVQIEYYSRQAA